MQVLVAEKCGFCFGVERALKLAEQWLDQHDKVYCLGPLIHNKQAVDRLAQTGLTVVLSIDEIPSPSPDDPEPPTVLIRSHGCHPETINAIAQRGYRVADATCILVKRAQKLIKELHDQGYQVIIIGDPNHPEIQAAIGYAPDVIVVAGPEDLDNLPPAAPLAIVSQTTLSPEDFGRLVGLMAQRGFPEMKVLNTICRETAHRQASAVLLCDRVDVMFVLGGSNSANTRELAQLCRRHHVETYHLENWSEFKPQYIEGKSIAGVTAGASTPDWIIREFVDNLRQL